MVSVYDVGIERGTKTISLTLQDAVAATPEIDFRRYAGGMIHWLTATSHTQFDFHVAHAEGGTYHALQDKNNVAVTRTVSNAADECMPIPDECFSASFLKIVTTGGDNEAVVLTLKT